MTCVLVPVKDPGLAKSRLSGILTANQRRRLIYAMLEDVLDAISQSTGINGIVTIADDPKVATLACKYSASVFSERAAGTQTLNASLGAACDWLGERGVRRILILHSDMPLVSRPDIEALLAGSDNTSTDVVLGPDLANDGTNALLFPLSCRPGMLYGPASFSRYKKYLEHREIAYQVLRRPGIGLDIDTASDLQSIFESRTSPACGSRTAEFLSRPDIVARLHCETAMSAASDRQVAAK